MPRDINWEAECGDTPVYNVNLETLTIDGVLIPGFSGAKVSYDVELPFGTTTPPIVAATAVTSEYNPVIVQATTLPGSATVTVTATEDAEVSKTYTINFTVSNVDPSKNTECEGWDNTYKTGASISNTYHYKFETTAEGINVFAEFEGTLPNGVAARRVDIEYYNPDRVWSGFVYLNDANQALVPFSSIDNPADGTEVTITVTFDYEGGGVASFEKNYHVGEDCNGGGTSVVSPASVLSAYAYADNGTIHITNIEVGDQIYLYDVNGKLIHSIIAQDSFVSADIQKGLYIVKVINENGSVALKVLY